jgi:hypothetical protein
MMTTAGIDGASHGLVVLLGFHNQFADVAGEWMLFAARRQPLALTWGNDELVLNFGFAIVIIS